MYKKGFWEGQANQYDNRNFSKKPQLNNAFKYLFN